MGKGSKWKKKKNKAKSCEPKKERPQSSFEEIVRENPNFETYYKAQKLIPEEEWASFISCLQKDLPTAFRLTGTKSHAKALLTTLKEKFFVPLQHLTRENGDQPTEFKPMCLPWYPDNLAWQLNLTRKDIRHCETYWKLHQFLISETETGNISRQEAVSMIPPLVLDVLPHHKVLDMCAAPGSKTAQIIEYLHNSPSELEAAIPPGVVVANDADNKRCYMLTHQAKRLQSPTLVITNHDAAFMPNILHRRKDGTIGPIKFDRILCDVPCSGDGTLRKNFDVWAKWNAVNGANLHGLQLRIARRGLEMLTVGGKMVYSTCSLNPLENEAVINRLLSEAGGAIELIDVTNQLPNLKFTPGLSDWVLMNREMELIPSPDEIPVKNLNLFHKHLFPPSSLEIGSRHLERCIRILPHHQDTGGFFVAVLRKITPMPGEKIYEEPKQEVCQNVEATELTQRIKKPPKKRRRGGFKEEPFFYMKDDDPTWTLISDFYGMEKDIKPTHFLKRTEEGKGRKLYFTNSLVKELVDLNQDRVKIINTGVKVLARCDNFGATCNFRLSQDGSQVLLPFLKKRKIYVTDKDLSQVLLINDVDMPLSIDKLDQHTQHQCVNTESGSVAFICEHTMQDGQIIRLQLVGWKGKNSIRCYVGKNERLHYLRLLNADTTAFEVNKFQEQRLKDEQNKETCGNDSSINPMEINGAKKLKNLEDMSHNNNKA